MPKVINGTTYDERTSDEVIGVLERVRQENRRIRVHYGYTFGPATGRDWHDEFDVTGTVCRSCGPVKIPVLLANRRASDGAGSSPAERR